MIFKTQHDSPNGPQSQQSVSSEWVSGPKPLLSDVQGVTRMLGCCIMLVTKQQQQGSLVVKLTQLRTAAWVHNRHKSAHLRVAKSNLWDPACRMVY
jgi:hypothetical protein